ncbi:PEGA domain-containing protein [Sorangium sp. So ce1389]|uniref:PEGA domain-containing protein n=1 Tax=Sorangium sp. So ce1389 TaxID=3133336 RepID=UPI003F61DC7C
MVKDHVRRGRRARDAGRWAEAHAAYKAAFEATDPASGTELERTEIAGELGLCELALRMYRDAAEHLAWSLEQREALPPAQQRRFGEGLRKARPFVATLILAVDPPDAEVLVDGKAIGRTARTYKLFFEPGHHMVRARAPGHGESLHGLRAVAAAEHEISIKLLPDAAVSRAKDQAPAAPKPASASPPARAQAPGPPADVWASWPGTLRIAGIGLTAATGSLGVVFMVRASTADGDLEERNRRLDAAGVSQGVCREPPKPAVCSELTRLRRARDLFAGLGTAMVVTSGVVGAATLASFFTDFSFLRAGPTRARLALTPAVTPAQVGLVAHGAW